MKQKLQIIISASAGSVLAFAALAQYPTDPKMDRPESHPTHLNQPRADRLNGAAKASDLIGMTVKNYQDVKLGKVEDLAVDVESGRVVQVILSTGGFLGMGDTLTAVPPGALHHDVAQKVLHLAADPAKLTAAPPFDNAKWDEGTQSNRLHDTYAYYGQEPYFAATRDETELTSLELKAATALPRHLDGTINTDGPKTVEKVRNEEIARTLGENYDSLSTRNPDGTWNREYFPNGRRINPDSSRLGIVQKASKVIGTSVKNLQDEKLGDVNNVLVDLAAGRIVAVIISSGGFLGLGDELSAIPPTALRFTPDQAALQLDTTKDRLGRAPHFKSNQWPDFNQPSYASGVYRAYQMEPYFPSAATSEADNTRRNVRDRDDRTSRVPEPDNTARNVRDRDDRALTPLNQGNSKADLATTAQIRKEITAGKNLSVNARNVKIITQDGQITLRGPVNTAEEKRRIGDIAERSAHSGTVDNQLEVKPTTKSTD
jgi:sporulation protein YlmC with PRC-barrel domain